MQQEFDQVATAEYSLLTHSDPLQLKHGTWSMWSFHSTFWDVFLYNEILSVLDPRKCGYLKDYSLDFEHAYDYITLLHESMSILEEMLEMFTTTVQAELNTTLHVCKSVLQDDLTNRSNFTSNVVFQFLYGAWLVGISFSF